MTVVKILAGVKVLTAMIGIIIMECYALSQGINGLILTLAIAAVAGLGGYELDNIIKALKGGKVPPEVTSVTLADKWVWMVKNEKNEK